MNIAQAVHRRIFAGVVVTCLAAILSGCSSNTSSPSSSTSSSTPAASTPAGGTTYQIAVIPKGSTHSYWESIHAGANKAAQELAAKGTNVKILWQGPAQEDDRTAQINIVQTFVAQGVNAIVLAPLDEQALAHPVESAVAAKIPVVIINSPLNSTAPISTVATNNEKGGELGGAELVKDLGGKGRVLMVRYQQGSASTEAREKGFLAAIAKAPGITIVSSDQYAGPTVDTAFKASQNVLSRFGAQVDGIFCPNESSTLGMLLAIKDANLTGKVKVIGFDTSPKLVQALQSGAVQGLVAQDPVNMGYLGVMTAVDALQGKTVPLSIDTGVNMITPQNMNTPKMQALMNPPLSQYLK